MRQTSRSHLCIVKIRRDT